MGKGRTYELNTVSDVNEAAGDDAFCSALDYSGVAGDSTADIQVCFWKERDWFSFNLVELKKRSGTRGKRLPTHPLKGSAEGEAGLEELERLVEGGPGWTDAWFLLNIANCEPVLFSAEWLLSEVTDEDDPYVSSWQEPPQQAIDAFQPRLTRGDNVSMRMPETDEWPSARSGRNTVEVLLDGIGMPDHYWRDTE